MSGDDGFLARWARRKQGAAAPPRGDARPGGAKPDGAKLEKAAGAAASEASSAAAPAAAASPDKALFDPARLPPLDSIGAGSDISAFLAPGVPVALTRAALRRAWLADPAIRDFIGLSENAWDFNAVGGVPGFGPISADEVRRLLAQVTGEPPAEDPAPAAAAPAAASPNPAPEQPQQNKIAAGSHGDTTPGDKIDIAAQHELGKHEPRPSLPRRGHGGALPK